MHALGVCLAAAALEYLKQVIPTGEPYRAWANAEFLGADGSVNEIDLLLITPAGITVLEVKSWSGTLTGDAGTWQQVHRQPVDNPVISATRKARKLKSLLQAQPAMRGRRVPWIDAAVFLSEPELKIQLKPEGRAHVYGPQGQRGLPDPDRNSAPMSCAARQRCPSGGPLPDPARTRR